MTRLGRGNVSGKHMEMYPMLIAGVCASFNCKQQDQSEGIPECPTGNHRFCISTWEM